MKNMHKSNYLRKYFDGLLIAISIEFTIYVLKQLYCYIVL